MSHEVENLMYVGATPWHKIGVKLNAPPTTAEAIKAAGLDWEAVKVKNYARNPVTNAVEPTGTHAVYRKTDGQLLAPAVGDGFRLLQNAEAFAWFDPFLQAGEATLEVAASLRDGSRLFILAKLSREDSVIVPRADDRVSKYLLLSNSHDGSLAVRVGFTPIRVVCANTLAEAHAENVSRLLSVRHTAKMQDALADVHEVINIADERFEATADKFRLLASRGVDAKSLEKYVRLVVATKATRAEVAAALKKEHAKAEAPIVGEGSAVDSILASGGIGDAQSGLVNEILVETEKQTASRSFDAIMSAFETGAGNDLPGVRGTWWAAYNAVTDFVTHGRRGTDSSRVDSLSYGSAKGMNDRALAMAMRMSNGATV